jgi:hypothetical protein
MLSDDDLERALKRYRVADPPSDFESTIVASAFEVAGRFEWMWGPAAAATVLAAWIGLHIATADSPSDPVRDQEVAFVTQMLGGDENAATYAELVVPQQPKRDALGERPEDQWREN